MRETGLNLPDLPDLKRRQLRLLWTNLIEEHGFTGEHLRWRESSKKRHEAARPTYEVHPSPPRVITDRLPPSRVTYRGVHGEPISYEEAVELRRSRWAARERDPAVVESIGIVETTSLAKQRFTQFAEVYFQEWSDKEGASCDEFGALLDEIGSAVEFEMGRLWGSQNDWYVRACSPKVKEAVAPLIAEWGKKARAMELQRIEGARVSAAPAAMASEVCNWHGFRATLAAGREAIAHSQDMLWRLAGSETGRKDILLADESTDRQDGPLSAPLDVLKTELGQDVDRAAESWKLQELAASTKSVSGSAPINDRRARVQRDSPKANPLAEAMTREGLNVPQVTAKVRALLNKRGVRRLKIDRSTIYRLVWGLTKHPNPMIRKAVLEVLNLESPVLSNQRKPTTTNFEKQ